MHPRWTEAAVFATKIPWVETDDVDYPYEATLDGTRWRLRLNDFPDEPMFTLFIGTEEWGHFDDWPPIWHCPPAASH